MNAEDLKLGHLVENPTQQRDAVHIAVIPVEANGKFRPGERVGVVNGKATATIPGVGLVDYVGVVDPYLERDVEPGERFWLFLIPGTIKSLHHEWTHPAFPVTGPRWSAEDITTAWARLEAYAKSRSSPYSGTGSITVTAKELVEAAADCGGITLYGDEGKELPDEVWSDIEVVTGQRFDRRHREGTFFSCGC